MNILLQVKSVSFHNQNDPPFFNFDSNSFTSLESSRLTVLLTNGDPVACQPIFAQFR